MTRFNCAWSQEKDNALILMFEEGKQVEIIARELVRSPLQICSRLRSLGFMNSQISDQDNGIISGCRTIMDYKSCDERFQEAMRAAIADGLERPHVGTIVDTSPLTYERRTYSSVSRDSGCGSAAALCAEWA